MAEGSNRAASRDEGGSTIVAAIFRNLVSIFFLGVAVMCVYNVFGVGGEVEAMAKEKACQGQQLPCTAQYTRAARTPFAHTFKMYTSGPGGTSSEKDIDCRRQYILIGDYSCNFAAGSVSADVMPSAIVSASSASSSTTAPIKIAPKIKPPVAPKPATSAPAASP